MIHVIKANPSHVDGIVKVCTEANRATYGEIYTKDYLESIIKEFYSPDQILKEVSRSTREWGGYFVALDNGKVVGAGGGGMTSLEVGEIYVLYLDPSRRNEGIGTLLLNSITAQQKNFNATEQWLSVQKGNHKGIPFYESKGFELQSEELSDGYVSLRYKRKI
ncbi:GNAT family N-acetyltransferase [Paucisalibacillus sp. EB02]|uniref:GNAT family N-acetyltransferase n=1 Tax=Paucisalibacillus sp. EB02 TaxID=1347087 RepID=UPI0005A7F299|nr:GNAT family N-acetyltransferase [Paucisalibacillus sp. EB02]